MEISPRKICLKSLEDLCDLLPVVSGGEHSQKQEEHPMAERPIWYFAPFHVDLEDERLWRNTEAVRLTAKAFAVLRHLVEHAGQLVTREELLAAVWGTTYVSDAALAVCIRELRQALGDTAQTPQYVETVRGRGYRFIAPVTATPISPAVSEAAPRLTTGAEPSAFTIGAEPLAFLVGREAAFTQLWQRWEQALQGKRQVIFITGEAGIGKTTLVDAWVAQVTATNGLWLSRGQCIEQHAAGEA
jgi:DNA-binding winged helix-turn-helix (wHTH) protein